ncbi:transposase [Streptosporangium minutum]|uniref:transposase n=1 Tax=Streptosporangium minutum TaxID=569862 RepID=UPI000D52A0CD|nr:transposase [Streptosporangium minutum]
MGPLTRPRRSFSPEVGQEIVRMVMEDRSIVPAARESDMNTGTLNNWVTMCKHAHPAPEVPLSGPVA